MNIKKIFNSSIKAKTMFYLILFSFFIILLFWESEVLFSKILYEKYQVKDVTKIAEEIHNIDLENLDDYLKNVIYNNAVCIEYVDMYNRSYLYNDASTGCLLGRKDNDLSLYKKELYNSNEEVKAIKLVNKDYKSLALLYGVRLDEGYVYIYSMLSSVDKNSSIIKDQLIYMAIIISILAVIISLFLARLLSEPIENITDKAKQLARGDYTQDFLHYGIREIDELADTLNYLESEVSKTDQYRRDLMANVSHDLKTPLTMIKAYAEMVRDITYKDKDKRDANLNVIIEETDRLNVLVGDILSISKLQENTDTLELETFDLNKEIESILTRYDYLIENEEYVIEADMPENVIIRADKKKINQVIYNLVNNAINYTGDDKKVIIRVTDKNNYYLVEIIDSGKGIDKEQIGHIWDKYYKNDKNHKRQVVGTGLGLFIVKNILEIHDFTYGVKSTKNKGTTFYFKINKDNIGKNNS